MGEMTERDRVVREWALGVAKRHRDRHWCWGVADGTEGQFMFGGRVIGRDCDARNAALSLIGRIEVPDVMCEHHIVGPCGACLAEVRW